MGAVFSRVSMLLVILSTGGLMFFGLLALRAADEPGAKDPLPVGVFAARIQDKFQSERKFAGRLVPQRTSDLGFKLGGRVDALLVDEGERVEKDQPLARLDISQLENRRADLAAQRAEIQSQLTRVLATLRRQQDLLKEGFSTQQQVDDLIAERDGLRARLQQIEAGLAQVDTDVNDSTLRAPFAGEIIRRFIDEGAVVSPGQQVLRLNEGGPLEARIGVPTTYRRRIQIGDTYTISANGLEGTGTVTSIVTDVSAQTRTLTVILSINEDPGFVARDLVRMILTEEIRRSGMWVPTTALNESLRGLWAVYVVNPMEGATAPLATGDTGTIERRDVEVISTEEDRTYVRGTLEDGQQVVTSSPFRFVPGQLVRIAQIDRAPVDPAYVSGDAAP